MKDKLKEKLYRFDEEQLHEYLATAIQSGKRETSGLITAYNKQLNEFVKDLDLKLVKMMQEHERAHRNFTTTTLIVIIIGLISMFIISGIFVLSTQVTQQDLEEAVTASIENYGGIIIEADIE